MYDMLKYRDIMIFSKLICSCVFDQPMLSISSLGLLQFYFQLFSTTLVLEEEVQVTGVSVMATYHSET